MNSGSIHDLILDHFNIFILKNDGGIILAKSQGRFGRQRSEKHFLYSSMTYYGTFDDDTTDAPYFFWIVISLIYLPWIFSKAVVYNSSSSLIRLQSLNHFYFGSDSKGMFIRGMVYNMSVYVWWTCSCVWLSATSSSIYFEPELGRCRINQTLWCQF